MTLIILDNINSLNVGTVIDIRVGDEIKLEDINQGLPKKEYNPKIIRNLVDYWSRELKLGYRFGIKIPCEKGKRYVLIRRTK